MNAPNYLSKNPFTIAGSRVLPVLSICALSICGLAIAAFSAPVAAAAADTEALAKASQNPVASLISLPLENNLNSNVGPDNDPQNVFNIKPVIPVGITEELNLINRVIMPVISQPGYSGGPDRKTGLGDTTYQAFFSPAKPGAWIWGFGPQVQIPTHTDELLGNEHWGAGPAAVVLTMPGHWVTGALVAQMWDFAGSGNDGSNQDISQLVFQPFVNYNFGGGWYINTGPVLTANWEANSNNTWTIPLGGGIGRVMHIGKQAVNLRMANYYNVERPKNGADWDFQLTAIFLFPKGE